ncbi:hypothetical protein HYR99_08265 [Candidatus Poribacteria bacterium]|nr:hypothetical protein [Candidatus Poribacteria bacterium]
MKEGVENMFSSRQQFIADIEDRYIQSRRNQTDFSLEAYDLTPAEKQQILDTYKIEQIFSFLRRNYDPKVIGAVLYKEPNESTEANRRKNE